MKSLTIHTLAVAVALALLGTPSMAGTLDVSGINKSESGLNKSEKDTTSVTTETSPAPLHALSRLDARNLASQEMTDQELKVVEGGVTVNVNFGEPYESFLRGFLSTCGCRLVQNR